MTEDAIPPCPHGQRGGDQFCIVRLRAQLDAEALRSATLQSRIESLEARLHPCKAGCFRKATHAKRDVIFGVVNAELCEECAKYQAEVTGETWVLKEAST